jgi:hypothetical protein
MGGDSASNFVALAMLREEKEKGVEGGGVELFMGGFAWRIG